MRWEKTNGITLIALILTIVILVIIAAVAVKNIYDSNVIDKAEDGALDYAYEQEKEKISEALYVATIQSFIEETIEFDYSEMAQKVTTILNDSGQFTCTLIDDDVDGYSIYNVVPEGKGFYFVLKISNSNGSYELTLGE